MDRYWPERITVFLGLALFVVLILMSVIAGTINQSGADAAISIWGFLAIRFLLPIWLLLRGFDLCFLEAGRHRR